MEVEDYRAGSEQPTEFPVGKDWSAADVDGS